MQVRARAVAGIRMRIWLSGYRMRYWMGASSRRAPHCLCGSRTGLVAVAQQQIAGTNMQELPSDCHRLAQALRLGGLGTTWDGQRRQQVAAQAEAAVRLDVYIKELLVK